MPALPINSKLSGTLLMDSMQLKELRKLVRSVLQEEMEMITDHNPEVVLSFLKDRNVEDKMRNMGLSHLIDNPNLSDELENHIRVACLVGCKGEAQNWLGFDLGTNDETAERRFCSASKWQKHDSMDSDWFKIKALNVWGQPFYSTAKEYQASQQCADEHTMDMFSNVNDTEINRTMLEPSTTIWVPHDDGIRCVEGNKRMHALALGMVRGVVGDDVTTRWKMWSKI